MNQKNMTLTLALGLMLGMAFPAAAIPILNLVPSNSAVNVGEQFSVDVLVNGLENEFIGDYDLTIGWDASLLSLSGFSFDAFLDGPADSISGFSSTPGSVNAFEVSLSSLSAQTGFGGFRLFSLSFSSLDAGLVSLFISDVGILGNELGESYDFGRVGAEVSLTRPSTSVPEPSTLALLLAAAAGGALSRRRRLHVA